MTSDNLEVPSREDRDLALATTRGLLSSIPGLGGAVAELFDFVIAPPLERRRDAWMANVAAAIEELRQSRPVLTAEALSRNEGFITAAIHASQLALRNHQKEKLEALRNAVLNSALP
ncbi:MAG TPA: hypothetical protein VJB57_05980, partial [Dehalococcoidia bacterium]|nr:hypothetical protein [Dehalococcoidia bacterium]